MNSIECRILIHDCEFFLDVTNEMDNLESINGMSEYDLWNNNKLQIISSRTNLNYKNKEGFIDLDNIKFCTCQIMK